MVRKNKDFCPVCGRVLRVKKDKEVKKSVSLSFDFNVDLVIAIICLVIGLCGVYFWYNINGLYAVITCFVCLITAGFYFWLSLDYLYIEKPLF